MTQPLIAEFEHVIHQLTGLECWNITAGAVGSMASLDLGAKMLRGKPMPFYNASLSIDEHKYRGEFVLYIEDCPWRLDGIDEVIASWTDSSAPSGPIITGLKRLIGQRIESVALTRPGLDLTVHFSGGLALRIFPDQSDPEEGDNYSLSVADERAYIVGARSLLRRED